MIKRTSKKILIEMAESFSVVTVTGPRQSGKTTLVTGIFPKKAYTNLEYPDFEMLCGCEPHFTNYV